MRLIVLVCAFLAMPSFGDESGLRLTGLDGGELRESELEARDTIVIVWASWSPRCRDIEQRVGAILQRWKSQVRVVTINFQEDPADIHKFLSATTQRFPVFLDTNGSFGKKHSITALPSILIYRDGIRVHRGRLPADADSVIKQWLSS